MRKFIGLDLTSLFSGVWFSVSNFIWFSEVTMVLVPLMYGLLIVLYVWVLFAELWILLPLLDKWGRSLMEFCDLIYFLQSPLIFFSNLYSRFYLFFCKLWYLELAYFLLSFWLLLLLSLLKGSRVVLLWKSLLVETLMEGIRNLALWYGSSSWIFPFLFFSFS